MKRGRTIAARVCPGCCRDFGIDGALPAEADVHPCCDGTMIVSCSSSCREKLGLQERKAVSR